MTTYLCTATAMNPLSLWTGTRANNPSDKLARPARMTQARQ